MMNLINGDKLADSIHTKLCVDLMCKDCSMCTTDGGCKVEEWLDNFPIERACNDTSVRF